MINEFLLVPRLQDPDRFIMQLGELRLLESCRYGLEKFVVQGGNFSLNTLTQLLSSLKSGRENIVLIKILLLQAGLKNNKDDFSEARYLLRYALGAESAVRVDLRIEMFAALNAIFPPKELNFDSKKIRFTQESILFYFSSVDEFMNLLGQTLQVPKIGQNRNFTLWLSGFAEGADSKFKEKIKSHYEKIWCATTNVSESF